MEGIQLLCDKGGLSSAHVTFPAKAEWEVMGEIGFLQRTGSLFLLRVPRVCVVCVFVLCVCVCARACLRGAPNPDPHVLTFPPFAQTGIQFHWHNMGFENFEDFLATLKQSKRKSIRQERNKVFRVQGLGFRVEERNKVCGHIRVQGLCLSL